MESNESKKRLALEEAGGLRKKINPSLNPPAPNSTHQTQIYYHSSVEDKENPLPTCIQKMASDASSLQYQAEQGIGANDAGFELSEDLKTLRAQVAALTERTSKIEDKVEFQGLDLDWVVGSQLDLRNRTLSTWVRDALKKDTSPRKEAIRKFNKGIHGGNIRMDAILVQRRFKPKSTERNAFITLYGLTAEDASALDFSKCGQSLLALNRLASILYDESLPSLPNEAMKQQREELVALLLERKYEEAEKLSPTICGDSSDG